MDPIVIADDILAALLRPDPLTQAFYAALREGLAEIEFEQSMRDQGLDAEEIES